MDIICKDNYKALFEMTSLIRFVAGLSRRSSIARVYDSSFFLRWQSLVRIRPTEYGKILCAIEKGSAPDEYWTDFGRLHVGKHVRNRLLLNLG